MTTEIGRIYRGHVQGVGFRAGTQRLAASLGLLGWVRNEPDGSVRLVALGEDDALESFQSGIEDRYGDSLDAVEPFEPDDEDLHTFEVRL